MVTYDPLEVHDSVWKLLGINLWAVLYAEESVTADVTALEWNHSKTIRKCFITLYRSLSSFTP